MNNYDYAYEETINYPELEGTSLENFDRWMDELRANAEADADRMEELGYGGDDEAGWGTCGHAEYDGACSAETCGRAMTESAFRARLAEVIESHDPLKDVINDEWVERCVNYECSHHAGQRCGRVIIKNGWHESRDENRLLTVEEYVSMPWRIAESFVNRWVSDQADKETALHMADALRDTVSAWCKSKQD
jgi:hypothetical protein